MTRRNLETKAQPTVGWAVPTIELARYFPVGAAYSLLIPAGAVNLATEFFESTGQRGSLDLRARQHEMDGAQAPQGIRKTGLDARILDARCRFKRAASIVFQGSLYFSNNQMRTLLGRRHRISAILLLSLLPIAQSALSHPYPDNGDYPFPDAFYSDQWATYGPPPYSDPTLDFRTVDPVYPPERTAHRYREGPCRASPDTGWWSAPPCAAFPHPEDRSRQPGTPVAPAYDRSGRVPMSGEFISAPAERYRTPGHAPNEFGGTGIPWWYRYRFRPLTEQERQRMGTEMGWRPQVPVPLRRANPLPVEEAYGYQPDNWFLRYFGAPR